MENSSVQRRVVGIKQTRKAVLSGSAAKVYLALDASPALTDPLRALCAEHQIPLVEEESMALIGRKCGIAVGSAAAADLK